jgi:muramidase (phage lysozyme)
MVKSPLSPEKIIGNSNPKSSFGLLSGKNFLGSSVISKSSNKIVGFNRAKVSANKGEVQKIVSNLTTNNITNSYSNIIKNVFGTLQAKQNKEEENKEKRFGIFGFFDSIKDAFNLIRFVGSRKNLDKIKDSLENLKITFSETFDTAKILRKIIKKIFEQLSGLSGDGGGGKGLWGLIAAAIASIIRKLFRGVVKTFSDIFERISKNENTMRNIIDKVSQPPTIETPASPSIGTAVTTAGEVAAGAGLAAFPAAVGTEIKALPEATKALPEATKALPAAKGIGNAFSRMPKMGKFGLITAGLSLATLGGSAMMNKSGLSQPGDKDVQPGDTVPEVPGNVLDRFNSILDRFDKILDGLKGGGKNPTSTSKGGGSTSSAAGGGSPIGSNPSGGVPDGKLLDQASSAVKDPNVKAFLDTIANVESGGSYNVIVGGKKFSDLSKHPESFNASAGSDAAGRYQFISTTYNSIAKKLGLKDFSKESQDLAAVEDLRQKGVLDMIKTGKPDQIQKAIDILKTNEWTGLQSYSGDQGVKYFLKRKGGLASTAPSQEQLRLPPGQQSPQGKSSLVVLPAAQQQATPSGGGGQITAPPSPKQNGPTAPFYPSSNYDNFLTLYSRMVYNIVDG